MAAYSKDAKKTLEKARKALKDCIEDESSLRKEMLDDARFATLDQWPAEVRKERENDIENGPRPCLTIDKLSQYLVQVVNDARIGKPGINVRPQDDQADVHTAKILKGLVRNIEDQSSADIAYANAIDSAAKVGLGFFRIVTEYATPDSFDQELFIRPLPNTASVYLGRHFMPDGSDAKEGFVIEQLPVEEFKRQYPGKKYSVEAFSELETNAGFWATTEMVTIAEYFCLERIDETLHFLADGSSISSADYDKWPEEAGVPPTVQRTRASFKEQLRWAKMTGVEVLEERDLPGKYIPIVEVIGRESWVEGKRILWGLVRPAKDSLRMYNYFASTVTEKIGLAPKTPFIGAKGQFEGLEDKWKKANRVNYAYLEYNAIDVNGNAIPRPERQGATPMEVALLHQMQVIEHDVQTSLGMFKAATGESESQQSGRAILALQRESDTGTYHFGANLGVSIRHAGRILIDLIPHYYDTKRIIRIIGEDGEIQTAQLDPEQETAHRQIQGPDGAIQRIYNPGVGKYDVSITVGPSYNTKRMEAAATYVEMAKGAADPASAAILRYLVMRNSDTAGSEEASKLLKTMLPPPALQALESHEPIPPQVQAAMQQMKQQMAMMQEAGAKLQQENQQLKSGAQEGMAKVQVAQAEAQADAALQKQKQDGELQLAREKADAEIKLKQAVAQADYEIEQRKLAQTNEANVKKLEFDQACRAQDQQEKTRLENETGAAALAPNLITSMQKIVQEFAQVIAGQQQFQQQLIEQMSKPKTLKLGGIQRGDDGNMTGASATIQ